MSTFLLMLFLGGVSVFFLEKYKFDVLGIKSALFILIPAIFLAIFYAVSYTHLDVYKRQKGLKSKLMKARQRFVITDVEFP